MAQGTAYSREQFPSASNSSPSLERHQQPRNLGNILSSHDPLHNDDLNMGGVGAMGGGDMSNSQSNS